MRPPDSNGIARGKRHDAAYIVLACHRCIGLAAAGRCSARSGTPVQVQNELLSSTATKLEGELRNTQRAIDANSERSDRLLEVCSMLARAQEQTDEKLSRCAMERKGLISEAQAVDKACAAASSDCAKTEDAMLEILSHQTTVEKGSCGAAKEVRQAREVVRHQDPPLLQTAHRARLARQSSAREIFDCGPQMNAGELRAVGFQNEIAKLVIDVMNTTSHNVKLKDTMASLDEDLADKAALVERYEVEIRKRNDEIQKKTRGIDGMNRTLEKLTSSQQSGEETGPMEATINSLNREIRFKETEGRDLQRHWIDVQTALVAKQVENEEMALACDHVTSDCSILVQKRLNLEADLDREHAEVRGCSLLPAVSPSAVPGPALGDHRRRRSLLWSSSYGRQIRI